MTPSRRQRDDERSDRLQEAEDAGADVELQRGHVDRQVSFAGRLAEGWRRVHERNHLAQIFHEQGGL